jgi:3'(2'), 5'-bisphosphate nucleotidase
MDLKSYLPLAILAAEAASAEILTVYNSNDFQAEVKGDNSPLTIADKKAHLKICETLNISGLPILSEEGKAIPYEERKNWPYFWMVDPLDGTKEFIKRNGEFTVNVALIHNQKPVLGVVAIPVSGEIFFAAENIGAFGRRNGKEFQLQKRRRVDLSAPGLRVVASRSHMNPDTELFIKDLKDTTLVSAGSSLKFLLVAEGRADVYPRFAPTMEWDTAAAHAVINGVGLEVYQHNSTTPLQYNKQDLLNPYFLVQ